MRTIKLMLCAFLIIGFIAGCKKDQSKSRAEMLIGHWMMTALTADSSGTTINIFAKMPTCNKDDHYIFETGGSYISDEGATKCDTSDLQQTTGTWAFNTDETVLTILEGTKTTILNINELTDNVFKGSIIDTSGTMQATLEKM